jgi:hypothetical protein
MPESLGGFASIIALRMRCARCHAVSVLDANAACKAELRRFPFTRLSSFKATTSDVERTKLDLHSLCRLPFVAAQFLYRFEGFSPSS